MCSSSFREAAGAHLLRVLAEALQGDLADVRVALHELRLVPCVDPEQVVEDEHLTVGRRPGADPDHRDLQLRHQRLGDRRRDRLEDDREAADRLQGEGLLGQLRRGLRGPSLRLEPSQGGRGLRRETDVAHHRDPGANDRAGAVHRGAAALQLDGLAARLLDEALGVLDRLLVR